jgi:hypothetical protein
MPCRCAELAGGFATEERGMSTQKVVASICRNGIVRIDTKCGNGAIPLCYGPIPAVTSVVGLHCTLCYDGKGYKYSPVTLEADDNKALKMVVDLSRAMAEGVAFYSHQSPEFWTVDGS